MSFASPEWLLVLIALPALAAAYLLFDQRRVRTEERFARPGLFAGLVAARPGWRRHLPPALLLVALASLIVGVARPRATVSVARQEATVVVAIDTSRSMAAKDVEPSRLDRARRLALAFVDTVPKGYRVAVVSIATKPELVAPATTSRAAARAAILRLRVGQGTALGDGIVRALAAAGAQFGPSATPAAHPPATVLVISDGAQNGGRTTPAAAARRAREARIPVNTVSLGTQAGVVEVPLRGGYTARVAVPADPRALAALARATGGRAYASPSPQALAPVTAALGSRLGTRRVRQEVTYAFAAAAAALMLAGGALGSLWLRRVP